METDIKKCWFYILGFENGEEALMSFRCETFCFDDSGITINHQHEFGEIVITLYTFQENYKKALKILNQAKAYLEKINRIKFLTLPVPEDWNFITTIGCDIKAPYSSNKNKDCMTDNINFHAIKQFLNEKIGQNEKWTRKFIKLQKLVQKYEESPQNKELMQEIIKQSSDINILLSDYKIDNYLGEIE